LPNGDGNGNGNGNGDGDGDGGGADDGFGDDVSIKARAIPAVVCA